MKKYKVVIKFNYLPKEKTHHIELKEDEKPSIKNCIFAILLNAIMADKEENNEEATLNDATYAFGQVDEIVENIAMFSVEEE